MRVRRETAPGGVEERDVRLVGARDRDAPAGRNAWIAARE